jgi:hypothetical protein
MEITHITGTFLIDAAGAFLNGHGLGTQEDKNFMIHVARYFIRYVANVKDFQRYLPLFEQMVKTFKFAK